MSDVSTNVTNSPLLQTVLDTLNSGWGYTIGGILLIAAGGYYGIKKANTPRFVIKQIRRRNLKEMKKLGAENTEVMTDLDQLLDSVESYAIKQKMTGSAMSALLAPLQQSASGQSGKNAYQSMAHIAKNIGDSALAGTLQQKAKQVKTSSPLMAGLLKRAGI